MSQSSVQDEILKLLNGGPKTASELLKPLGVSQPTLSRAIQQLMQEVVSFRDPGKSAPLYAALRRLPQDLLPIQSVYQVRSDGHIEPFAQLSFLSGGGTLERLPSGAVRVYEGLPPYIRFATPSGFLGRQRAQEVAKTPGFPTSLKDWGDDHAIAYLFTLGVNLPGNLVFGDIALQRELDQRNLDPTPSADDLDYYVGMATHLKQAAYGSSAGGEQPKFLWLSETSGHVIVKFAKRGSRMGDLLPMEHLALRSLGEVGVPVAQTRLLASDELVFLEVKRFDRLGRHGRVGMLSAGAVDDEFFGKRDSWPLFAVRCEKAGYLSAEDVQNIDVMAAFSELIGNNDRHFENISLLIDDDGEYKGVAPAYDILPMRYATLGAGVDPDLIPIEPKVGAIGAKPEVWRRAWQASERFWKSVQFEEQLVPTSLAMKDLADKNLARARQFVAPLLPAPSRDS